MRNAVLGDIRHSRENCCATCWTCSSSVPFVSCARTRIGNVPPMANEELASMKFASVRVRCRKLFGGCSRATISPEPEATRNLVSCLTVPLDRIASKNRAGPGIAPLLYMPAHQSWLEFGCPCHVPTAVSTRVCSKNDGTQVLTMTVR